MPKSRRGRRGGRRVRLRRERRERQALRESRPQYNKEERLTEPFYGKGWGREWPLSGPIIGWDDDSQLDIIEKVLKSVDPSFGFIN